MRGYPLSVIAGKEFRDHVRSGRFHLFLAIMLIVAVLGLIGGVSQYQVSLERYQETQIAAPEADDPRTTSPPPKPTVLSGFSQFYIATAFVGIFLGAAMGFDSVTQEKESKSLKLLLSHPVYRDEVITGKALGAAGAIALATGIILVFSFAVLLISGIVPSPDESLRIALGGGMGFLFIFSFYSIALFFSTVSPNSGSALVSSLLLIIILYAVVPTIGNGGPVTALLIGESPEPPDYPTETETVTIEDPEDPSKVIEVQRIGFEDFDPGSEEMKAYEEAYEAYSWRRDTVDGIATLVSPYQNYMEILSPVNNPISSTRPDLIRNIIAFLAFPMIFFGLAWVRFAREDVR
ncbi:ABC-2 type transport system permease protein [Methanofollis sp. W23]|uniref:ABC transporter permease n=1 Tax=Methanofollis sp. W23 TaxID=2817849 RepID=UPI001AE3EE65|nr:ABC transporter permease subunit [Methanofollis sp. W23]MBP2146696.1 ABC-2 type transport system permease protein [Methanofollis sp. W23]